MKYKENPIPTIRADERRDPETGMNEAAHLAATLNGALTWYAHFVAQHGARLLPREFEIALVPGPEELQ